MSETPPYRCSLCKRMYSTELIEGYCRACVALLIQEAACSYAWLYIQLNARRARMKQLATAAKEVK